MTCKQSWFWFYENDNKFQQTEHRAFPKQLTNSPRTRYISRKNSVLLHIAVSKIKVRNYLSYCFILYTVGNMSSKKGHFCKKWKQ